MIFRRNHLIRRRNLTCFHNNNVKKIQFLDRLPIIGVLPTAFIAVSHDILGDILTTILVIRHDNVYIISWKDSDTRIIIYNWIYRFHYRRLHKNKLQNNILPTYTHFRCQYLQVCTHIMCIIIGIELAYATHILLFIISNFAYPPTYFIFPYWQREQK